MSCLVPPENAEHPPHAPNLLQLTSLTFLVPAAICLVQQRLLGVIVHCSNAVCSVYVHRPDRVSTDNFVDVLDHFFVFSWVIYNGYILFYEKPRLSYIAISCAVIVAVTKVWTKFLPYRSLQRYAVHAAMHLCGTFGSILLLV